MKKYKTGIYGALCAVDVWFISCSDRDHFMAVMMFAAVRMAFDHHFHSEVRVP